MCRPTEVFERSEGCIPARKATSSVSGRRHVAAIGFFGDAKTHGKAVVELDCAGLKRHEVFEAVMIATDAVVQIHVIGTFYQSRTFTFDRAGTLTFSVDFGGDIEPVYRCRMTERNTLACLID